jgi:hypothetical protein
MKAGYNAYYAAFSTGHFGANHKPHQQNPPYPKNPQRIQWIKGWQIGQRNHETGKQFSYDPFRGMELGNLGREPFDKQKAQREQQRKQAEFVARQKAKQGKQPQPIRHASTTKRGTGVAIPVVNLKRLDKFNKKHRTKV